MGGGLRFCDYKAINVKRRDHLTYGGDVPSLCP